MGQITDNAIAWVQFRVAGGLKSSIWLAVAYATIVVAIGALIVMVNTGRSGSLDGAPRILLAIQAIIVGGITLFRILNAMERDTRAKLMESHRLMPIDSRLAVLGYAAGGGLPVLPIAAVNLLLGGIATSHVGLPISWWFWANGVLVSWCVFAWCVMAGGGMLGIGMGALLMAPIIVTFMTGGGLTLLVPGLAPLVSPLVGKTIFQVQSIGSEELVRWVICMVLQLPVAWVSVLAGARRFRAGDIPGLTGVLGSVLVLSLALSSVVTMVDPGMLPQHFRREGSAEARTVGTLAAMMLLGALVAMWHVNRHAVEFPGKYRGRSLLVRDVGVVLVVLAGAVAFLLAVPDLPPDWLTRAMRTVLELMIVVATTLLWARWAARRKFPTAISLAVIGAWCVLPLLAGVILETRNPWEQTPAGTALQISPMAMLTAIWNGRGEFARLPSLLMQLAVPAVGAILLLKGKRTEADQEQAGAAAAHDTAPSSFTDSPVPVDSQ